MKSPQLPDDDNPCRPRHFRPTQATAADQDDDVRSTLDLSRARLAKTGLGFIVIFSIIALRLVDVTILKSNADVAAIDQPQVIQAANFDRADILDRNGDVLATTITTQSLFADARQIADPAGTAAALAAILPDTDADDLTAKLKSGKGFIWLKRHLSPGMVDQVNELGIPGLNFQREEQRIYPQGSLTAHVVGYSDLDNHGLAGIERSFDPALAGHAEPLQLSIDTRLQAIVRDETLKTIADFNAAAGCAIVMKVKTGEILSLVSLPDFDPNNMDGAAKNGIFNRATLGVYEMGSVFKIFNTALALENHKATLGSMFDVTSPIHIGRFTIHDYEPQHHPISVADIFMLSSNIGSAKMALESGGDVQRAFLDRLGLLRPASIEIPEIGTPHSPNPWHDVNTMTVAFGHGISVSPMQLAIAANAIVNDGIMVPATLIKRPDGYVPNGTRVVSHETSLQMRKLMRLVVTDGTGKNANVPGYLVGGKTGTAEEVADRGYAKHQLLSSFIGVFPINDPQYFVLIVIDQPHGNHKSFGFATAGWTAAPAAARVIARMGPLLGVRPIEETASIHDLITVDQSAVGTKVAAD